MTKPEVGKLYKLINPNICKRYQTKIFYCISNAQADNPTLSCFVNIPSGSIICSAIWRVGVEIEETILDENTDRIIQQVLSKPRVKRYLNLKI